MKAHVFITNSKTFPVCRDKLFWGIGIPDCPSVFEEWINPSNSKKPYLKMLVDMVGVSVGDLVFLYERQVGFHGIYKVSSPLFFDTTNVINKEGLSIGEQWPLRVRLECTYYFQTPVTEDLLFSTPHYENVFWIWAYRKSQGARGCNTITPEAAEALTELLVKVNSKHMTYDGFDDYIPTKFEQLRFPLVRNGEKVALEDFLRGYILGCLQDENDLQEILGSQDDIEWYANNVPYHISQKSIDLLLFHKNFRYTSVPLRYQYSVVELKRDKAKPNDVSQLLKYSQWAGGRLANGEVEMIQPILIAYDFSCETINKARNEDFNSRDIKLVKYKAVNDDNIVFEIL